MVSKRVSHGENLIQSDGEKTVKEITPPRSSVESLRNTATVFSHIRTAGMGFY